MDCEVEDTMKKLVTGDQHFNHKSIIQFMQRPFKDIDEMNETLITNWNAKVNEGDSVYVLGDMFWDEPVREILDRLKGNIIYIPSQEWTHEKAVLEHQDRFVKIAPLMTIKERKIYITLCHYCLRTWPKAHYNSWHLFAHSHGRLPAIGKSHDAGVDNNKFFPLTFEEICSIMGERTDNPAYTKSRGFYKQKINEED